MWSRIETGRFPDRYAAGTALGDEMKRRLGRRPDVVVLGLPRGGIPVADGVAEALVAPLDVFLVRKLGLPGQEELAMGAIASGGVRVMNDEVLRFAAVSGAAIEAVAAREQKELERREAAYRGGRGPLEVAERTVVVVDDGLATGSTMRAAVRALRLLAPREIVVAVPVGSVAACRDLTGEADQVVCLRTPEPFEAVGLWYEDFTQTGDEEVHRILRARGSGDAVGRTEREER